MESHLLQMRGLKLMVVSLYFAMKVASFTDAWIETNARILHVVYVKSHLLQMRGLKLMFN